MRKMIIILVALAFCAIVQNLSAVEAKKNSDKMQRQASGVIDVQRNLISNFDFMISNNGIMGLDISKNTGRGIWPRGSQNQYLYASGFWFGGMRQKPDNSSTKKYVELSYNPNSGNSWFVPGMIADGDTMVSSLKDKYRLYFSDDFNLSTGAPLKSEDGPNWPLWITDTLKRYQYGTFRNTYISNTIQRNTTNYPLGPLFVSDEDILSIFKDTDLSHFEGYQGVNTRQADGYPLGLQCESRIYSWSQADMKDVIIHSYLIENKSNDTIKNCWIAGVYDVDIGWIPDGIKGAMNDHVRFYNEDASLNLAVGWTDTTEWEAGKGFGYIGVSLLETPAVDANGYIRNDKLIFEPSEQLGLKTFRNWNIADDVSADDARYDFISSGIKDGDNGSGDKRMLMATGPFNMVPGDVARVVFGVNFALPAKGGEADGTTEDLGGLTIASKKQDNPQAIIKNSLIDKLIQTRQKYYPGIPLSVNIGKTENKDFRFNAIYPNPTSKLATISYNLSLAGNVKLSIFNGMGQEIEIFAAGWQDAGNHNLPLSIGNDKMSSGLYFVKLQVNNDFIFSKLVIIR